MCESCVCLCVVHVLSVVGFSLHIVSYYYYLFFYCGDHATMYKPAWKTVHYYIGTYTWILTHIIERHVSIYTPRSYLCVCVSIVLLILSPEFRWYAGITMIYSHTQQTLLPYFTMTCMCVCVCVWCTYTQI